MQRFSLKLTVALLTFVIGLVAAMAWYLRKAEPAKPQPAGNAESPAAASIPIESTPSDPCSYPRPNNRRINAEEAILLAECFIIQNGYTDLPPIKDQSQLTPESVYPGTDEEGMRMRHDSLEREAYGFVHDPQQARTARVERPSPQECRHHGCVWEADAS